MHYALCFAETWGGGRGGGWGESTLVTRNTLVVMSMSFRHLYRFQIVLIIYFKGPLQYLLRPLLGKNQFSVTQGTYACTGPNLDNIY